MVRRNLPCLFALLLCSISSQAFADQAVPYPDDLRNFQSLTDLMTADEIAEAGSLSMTQAAPQEDGCGWGSQVPGFCGGSCSQIRYKNIFQPFLPEEYQTCQLIAGTCTRPFLACSCDSIGGAVISEFPCSQTRVTRAVANLAIGR